jgi:hypothetical protein
LVIDGAPTIFLLSPARCSGPRAAMLVSSSSPSELSCKLRSTEGATIGEVFAWLSALYFRGKLAYARAFAASSEHGLVIAPGFGLRPHDERIDAGVVRAFGRVEIAHDNEAFVAPLRRDALAIARAHAGARVVLLGSIATDKYVAPLLDVFADNLLFPADFVGRGDMSRGAMMLRAARAGVELAYAPVAATKRTGPRATPIGRRRR